MPRAIPVQLIVGLFAFLACGCSAERAPKPVDIRDFSSGPALRDTLLRLVPRGTPVSRAQKLMEESGFKCDQRAGIVMDPVARKLGSGPPHLECWNSNRIFPWYQHRDWTVSYRYDSAGVTDVIAGYIIQP
jgi:hypothetical protein